MSAYFIRTFVLISALAVQANAGNFSGRWAIPGAPGRGPTILTLNQVGNTVTGSITPPASVSTGSPANTDVFGGRVEGNTITFYIWTGRDKPVKAIYRGTQSGDEIPFTISREAPGSTEPSKVTATRTHLTGTN